MSEVAASVPPMLHPWRSLRRHQDITVRWKRMPGLLGTWCERTRTITLHPDQSQRQRRCTLTHETIHAERGHQGNCTGAVERAVNLESARRLIPLDRLAEALAWSQDEGEVADELWVDVETTRARIDGLTDTEKNYIEHRIAAKEEAA